MKIAKKFGNQKIFKDLVNELNFIQNEGISVSFQNIHTVKIITCGVIGDNLGISSIFDLTECFVGNRYCRFCRNSKDAMNSLCIESGELRNIQNYNSYVQTNNVSLTGVKQYSIFKNITNFHVTLNFIVDIMHDLLEGVCHYDMHLILTECVKLKYFNINQLNYRILNFHYGPQYTNKPPLLSDDIFKKKNFECLQTKCTFLY